MAKKKKSVQHRGFASLSGVSGEQKGLGCDASEKVSQMISSGDWDHLVSFYEERNSRSLRGQSEASIQYIKPLVYQARDLMSASLFQDAAPLYCQILALSPANLDALRGLAVIDNSCERFQSGLDNITKAIDINPLIPSLWGVRLISYAGLNCIDGVTQSLDRALSLGLDVTDILAQAIAMLEPSSPDDALGLLDRIWRDKPFPYSSSTLAIHNLARRYCEFEFATSVDLVSHVNQSDPSLIPTCSISLLSSTGSTQQNHDLSGLMMRWYDHCSANYRPESLASQLSAQATTVRANQIRLGFVGGDFCNHVVSKFILPIFRQLDRNDFWLSACSTRSLPDTTNQEFKNLSDSYIDLSGLDPRELAEKIRAQEFDICIDLSGFTAYSALTSFAYRLAPVQFSMIGYPGSTFTPNMDYLLMDRYLLPRYQSYVSEKPLIMDGSCYCTIEPSVCIDPYENLPQERNGFINFGVLINPWKYSQDCISAWAHILRATKNSQISIVRPECKSIRFQNNILSAFYKHGIGVERILIANNHGKGVDHLSCYKQIDIVLDTFPMTGGASTSEAILMGRPVVTLVGGNVHERISASMLFHAGLQNLIASNVDEYIAIACRLAQDIQERRSVQIHGIGHRSTPGGLCDQASYANRFEKVLRAITCK